MKLKDINKKNEIAQIVGSNLDIYNIYDSNDGLWCDCPARKRDCKHIKEFSFKRELGRALSLLEYKGYFTMQRAGTFETMVKWICRLRKESL